MIAFASTPVRAGISDPTPAGYTSIWVVPGVVNNFNQGTGFVCVAHTASTIGVEVFSNAGGPAVGSVTALTLAAGESASIVTQALPDWSSYTDLSIGTFFQGSARILGLAGSKISCSAFVSRLSGTSQYALPVVKAKGQKGQ